MMVTIVGAGNIGTQFAVHCAEKGHRVTIFSSKPECIQKELTIVNEHGEEIHKGTISCATNDAKTAFAQAELIFVTMPAYCMGDVAVKVAPFAREGMMIGLAPGSGGGECAFKACVEKGAVLFGLQRVPSVARLIEYGKTVRATGYRGELFAAALPGKQVRTCSKVVEDLFDIRCTPLPNYLNVTLTPSNPILHTTRLRTLFRDYHDGVVYPSIPLFYEDWDDVSSELLLKCDDEVQALCRTLDQFDLSYVKSLRVHYESPTGEAMTKKLSSIAGFKGLPSPAVQVEGGYKPDFGSRYFTADFPYGLSILVQIADLTGLAVPNMKATLQWYYDMVGRQKSFSFRTMALRRLRILFSFIRCEWIREYRSQVSVIIIYLLSGGILCRDL